MEYIISGIQQLGVGVRDVYTAFHFYRRNLGMDVKMFEEAADAALMLPYTSGEVRSRHAILAINLQGGGGFEIWQYTTRKPLAPIRDISLGDLGIYAGIVRSNNVSAMHQSLTKAGLDTGAIFITPDQKPAFFFTDPFGNKFMMLQDAYLFHQTGHLSGGPMGAVIGVSDMDEAIRLFRDLLGYDKVLADRRGRFSEYALLPGGTDEFRHVVLAHKGTRSGAFSRLIGPTRIELLEVKGKQPFKIFDGRDWGDLGFIHLCFDINGMDALHQRAIQLGYPFTVDSASSFDMGEAAGRFAYIEMQGTLIEFVETHKIPILKKIGWYLNLRKRPPTKPLPDWILKALRYTRQKS